ncbi:toll-like receptor 4 [Littorina saxatilis]|uniref:toll-like receptor 4 n=1 Tax=Littorina saxatilis TaxID=31220 RepID=UPI0038B66CD4
MNGANCDLINDDIFDHIPSLRHLSLSNSRLTQNDIHTRAHRLFQHLERLEILDLSRNWLVEIEERRLPMLMDLKELRLSYNSFQTIPVNLDLHSKLTALDLSFNSVPSLTSLERQSLDDFASHHEIRLQLTGNPLLCACSNLDFVRWLRDTSVILDGEGASTRRYTCTAETGEITDTEQVMADIEYHWRRCIGQRVFGYTLAAFLLQLLGLLLVYLCFRSWTHVRYFWNVVRRLRLPRRQDFGKDVYMVYADQDTELACLDLPRCLRPYGVRLLLRSLEDAVGSVKAENIVTNIENSWKVLLLVPRAFAEDDWSCGFTVQQAQRSITDTLPDRVLVLFMDDPSTLPPMASLELLMRNYPERNVFHVHRDTPVEDPVWQRLAEAILGHDI